MTEQKNNRELILKNATYLFYELGYEKTTIRKIAAACGIKHPAIFNHFDSKFDIAAILMFRYVRGVIKLTQDYVNAESAVREVGRDETFVFYWTAHFYFAKTQPKFFFFSQFTSADIARLTQRHDYFTPVFEHLMEWDSVSDEDAGLYAGILYSAMYTLSTACVEGRVTVEKGVIETLNLLYSIARQKPSFSDEDIRRFVRELDYDKYVKYDILNDMLLSYFGEPYPVEVNELFD